MAYSRSRITLERMLPSLQPLIEHGATVWLMSPGSDPQKFAYQLREALFVSKLYADEYPLIAQIADRFIIEVIGDKVQARIGSTAPEAKVLAEGDLAPINQGLAKAGPALLTEGPQSEFTIIETWRRAQPSNEPIAFPNANLTDLGLERLYNFCQNTTPKLMMMVSGPQVILARVDPAVVEYSWTPADKAPTPWEAIGLGAREQAEIADSIAANEPPIPEDNDL